MSRDIGNIALDDGNVIGVSTFSAGRERGQLIQVTPAYNRDYFSMTPEQARRLAKLLRRAAMRAEGVTALSKERGSSE